MNNKGGTPPFPTAPAVCNSYAFYDKELYDGMPAICNLMRNDV